MTAYRRRPVAAGARLLQRHLSSARAVGLTGFAGGDVAAAIPSLPALDAVTAWPQSDHKMRTALAAHEKTHKDTDNFLVTVEPG
jgi:hypothetical protein